VPRGSPWRSPRSSSGGAGRSWQATRKSGWVHRAQEPAEGTRQKQRPRPGVDALARDIHEGDLEPVTGVRAAGPHEVTGEGLPVGRCRATSACHGSGSGGSVPCARSRSRRSTSIDSPSVPWNTQPASGDRQPRHGAATMAVTMRLPMRLACPRSETTRHTPAGLRRPTGPARAISAAGTARLRTIKGTKTVQGMRTASARAQRLRRRPPG
jgi:hypothetical protein